MTIIVLKRLLIWNSTIILALLPGLFAGCDMAGSAQSNMTPEINTAKSRVYDFLKAEGESRTRDEVFELLLGPDTITHPNLGEVYKFKGSLGEFWVTANRYTVINYNRPGPLKISEAKLMVSEFLKKHIPDFEKRNFVQVDSYVEDPLWKEEWREKPQPPKEQAIFENWVTIAVHLEARQVKNFNCSDLRHVRVAEPKFTETQASEQLLKQFPGGSIETLRLMEHTGDGGKNWVTIWHAVVQPAGDDDDELTPPRQVISLNADTGEVVQ